jgi:hypothetical protein
LLPHWTTRERLRDDGGMVEQDDPEDDAPAQSNRGALLALGVVVLLIVSGLWLMHVLGAASATQDCLASGRTNCAPVAGGNG